MCRQCFPLDPYSPFRSGAAMESACAIPQNGLAVALSRGEQKTPSSLIWRNATILSCGVAVAALTGCDGLLNNHSTPPVKAAHARLHAESKAASTRTPVWGKSPTGASASAGSDPVGSVTTAINLVGLDEQQVEAVLGAPTEQEDRAPAKTWRYRSGSCTVDLALYPDVETRVFRTLSYAVTTDDDTAAEERLCLATLQSRGHAK